jgi:large conductance mechanosensitive channel
VRVKPVGRNPDSPDSVELEDEIPYDPENTMLKDFKAFIMRGNVLDLAVAVVIGAAFGAIVKSLTDDIIMPPIGLLLGGVDFADKFMVLKAGATRLPPYTSVADAKAAGATTLNYGVFINQVVTFLIVAFAVFILVRMVSKLYAKPAPVAPSTKPCPHCTVPIHLSATRCPNCTGNV